MIALAWRWSCTCGAVSQDYATPEAANAACVRHVERHAAGDNRVGSRRSLFRALTTAVPAK